MVEARIYTKEEIEAEESYTRRALMKLHTRKIQRKERLKSLFSIGVVLGAVLMFVGVLVKIHIEKQDTFGSYISSDENISVISYEIQYGDTVEGIIQKVKKMYPLTKKVSVRAYVKAISEQNHIYKDSIHAHCYLTIPIIIAKKQE